MEGEGRLKARSVPKMKNLDTIGDVVDSIVNKDRSVHQLADAGPSVHGAPDVRKAPQQFHVV